MIKIENKLCKDCRWNKYPLCEGIIMDSGNFMNIENLRPGFRCGQKDSLEIDDLTPKKPKIEELEERIIELEKIKGVGI